MNILNILWEFFKSVLVGGQELNKYMTSPLVIGAESTSILGLLLGGSFIMWIVFSIVRD